MREIKFRGKRLDNGQWTEGGLIQIKNRMFIVDSQFGARIDRGSDTVALVSTFVREVDPETVGQYTGIPDRKVKEIYAGDILRHYSDARMYLPDGSGGWSLQGDPKVEERAAVVWSEEYGRMEVWGKELWIYAERSEIIGNIHDNPELLAPKEGADKHETD